MVDMSQPSWVAKLFGKAETDREILDVIVSVMKTDLKYGHNDFAFVQESNTLLIRGVVAVTWDRSDKKFCIAFSVVTEVLGAVVLMNCLHMNSIHNIKFQNSFYISDYEKEKNKYPVIYYGETAQKKYEEETYHKYKQKLMREMLEENLLHTFDEKQTYH